MTTDPAQRATTTPQSGKTRRRSPLVWTALLLAIVLSLVFRQSFNLRYVAFSNDGPLGQMVTEMNKMPSVVMGLWVNVNWLGYEALSPPPSITSGMRWVTSPQVYLNILYPSAMFIVGIAACYCLRRFKLSPVACILGGLAAGLNTDFFSTSCWGVASQIIGFGANYFALGLLSGEQRRPRLRLVLAGLAVGMAIMEAYDIGALFSLFVAAFVLYQTLFLSDTRGASVEKFNRGAVRVALVAVFAALISLHSLTQLVGTQIQGIVGTAQDKDTRQKHWDVATQWSLPKIEIIQVFMPGIFGNRMESMNGDNYWGQIGRSPGLDDLLKQRAAADAQGKAIIDENLKHSNYWRFSGTGLYAGVLVVIVALWAILQSLRKHGSPYSLLQRRAIWFWAIVLVVTVPLAFGRYAPFYKFFYALPYASTVRNPVKFMHVFHWALIIVFGYGVHGLQRAYMQSSVVRMEGWKAQFKSWFATATPFEKKWLWGSVAALAAAIGGWLLYYAGNDHLRDYIASVGIDPASAALDAHFSLRAAGWFVLFLTLTLGLLVLIFSGQFAGSRAKWGGWLLGALLVADLVHADVPWPRYWDVAYKYMSNPVVDVLRGKPWEHRVAMNPIAQHGNAEFDLFRTLYNIEWQQQVFPYHGIQSLEVVMEPRVAEDKDKFLMALPQDKPANILRMWELTSTRYLLGIGQSVVDFMNQQLDPAAKRFRLVEPFSVVPKPGASGRIITDYTAVSNAQGALGLVEFTGALPRASLIPNWLVGTNDDDTLELLADPNFDPHQFVVVATNLEERIPPGPNKIPGTVEITDYKSKRIEMDADVKLPSVLFVTDRYSPKWHAEVDGKPVPLLRCDFIMRGVYLEPGKHHVVMRYVTPVGTLYVSFAMIILGLGLCGVLIFDSRKTEADENRETTQAPH